MNEPTGRSTMQSTVQELEDKVKKLEDLSNNILVCIEGDCPMIEDNKGFPGGLRERLDVINMDMDTIGKTLTEVLQLLGTEKKIGTKTPYAPDDIMEGAKDGLTRAHTSGKYF